MQQYHPRRSKDFRVWGVGERLADGHHALVLAGTRAHAQVGAADGGDLDVTIFGVRDQLAHAGVVLRALRNQDFVDDSASG